MKKFIYEIFTGYAPAALGSLKHRALLDRVTVTGEVRAFFDTGDGSWLEIRADADAMEELAKEINAAVVRSKS